MKNKLLYGLIDKLISLLEESEDLFFYERKWLLDPNLIPAITPHYYINQNALEIKKVAHKVTSILEIEIEGYNSRMGQKGLAF